METSTAFWTMAETMTTLEMAESTTSPVVPVDQTNDHNHHIPVETAAAAAATDVMDMGVVDVKLDDEEVADSLLPGVDEDDDHHNIVDEIAADVAAGGGGSTCSLTADIKTEEENGDEANETSTGKKRGRPSSASADGATKTPKKRGRPSKKSLGSNASYDTDDDANRGISTKGGNTWNDLFFELMKFKLQKGHLNVPPSHGTLGKWVGKQRSMYAALLNYIKTHELMAAKLPLHSDVTNDQEGSKPDNSTDPIPLETPAVINEEVPEEKEKEEPTKEQLIAAIQVQDSFAKDPNSRLSLDRIEVLSSIGFVWDQLQYDLDARWQARFDELVQYKKINGHCNVPQNEGKLGTWVKAQRENKREAELKVTGNLPKRNKAKPCLSAERIAKLNSIGFEWRVAKPVTGWDNRYKQLLEYKAVHGDCNVPQSYPPDKSFGRWVMKQRCERSAKLKGEKSQLTDEREQKLNEIGFAWVAPNFTGAKKTAALSTSAHALVSPPEQPPQPEEVTTPHPLPMPDATSNPMEAVMNNTAVV